METVKGENVQVGKYYTVSRLYDKTVYHQFFKVDDVYKENVYYFDKIQPRMRISMKPIIEVYINDEFTQISKIYKSSDYYNIDEEFTEISEADINTILHKIKQVHKFTDSIINQHPEK